MAVDYTPVLVTILFGIGFSVLFTILAMTLGPKHVSAEKLATFECGSDPVGSARERFGVKFYMVALLFIVFDIESVFIYPWGALLRDLHGEGLGWFAYFEMLSFMATLAIGLVYVWRKGALEFNT